MKAHRRKKIRNSGVCSRSPTRTQHFYTNVKIFCPST